MVVLSFENPIRVNDLWAVPLEMDADRNPSIGTDVFHLALEKPKKIN